MKWDAENLFKYQKIRPKKYFRICGDECYCELKDSNLEKRDSVKVEIIDIFNGEAGHCKQLVCRCPKCYDPQSELADHVPSYLMDYNLLLLAESRLKNNFKEVKSKEKEIKYYQKLKRSINNDPYFKHLRRVANRQKLYHKKHPKKELYEKVFDRIGKIAKEHQCYAFRFDDYFSSVNFDLSGNTKITQKKVNYIHIHKNNKLIISIFFDKFGVINKFIGGSNFEIYDGDDVERYGTNKEDIDELILKAKSILKENI